jgi:leucyl-tRNA synthetase
VNEVNQLLNTPGAEGALTWSVVREAVETVVVLLSPVVPHMTEELWHRLGHRGHLIQVPWPTYREEALEVETKLIVLQVNGKVRSRIELPTSLSRKEIEAAALADERVQQFVGGKAIKKVVVVEGKLVNVVA